MQGRLIIEIAAAHLRRARALVAVAERGEAAVPRHIERARHDFGAFCALMEKPNAEHHKLWVDEFITHESNSQLLGCAGPFTAILAPRGPLAHGTRVAVPGGWAPIEEIAAGDLVFADDGTLTEVIGTYDYGEEPCFRVEFSDGTSMVCDDSHSFDVRRMGTDGKGEWRRVSLQEIRCLVTTGMQGNWRTGVSRTVRMATPGEKPWLDTRGHSRYQVPIAGAVDREPIELPLDPYLLGVLIGDGALTTGGSPRFHKSDPDLEARIRDVLPDGCLLVPCGSKQGSWAISTELGKRCPKPRDGTFYNPVTQALADLGLWMKKSHEKFIPPQYLLGSIEQRLALLQGLLDTDGTCANKTGRGGVSFGSSSERLMADITTLVQSLGGIAHQRQPYQSFYTRPDGSRKMCKMAYRASFRFPAGLRPFHMGRKAALYSGPASGRANGGLVRSIVDIHAVGPRKVRCIEIAHSNHRFVIDSYVVSNNSSKSTLLGLLTAWLIGTHAQAKMMLRILYLSYSLDIARSRSHTIKAILRSKQYQQVFPMVRLSKIRQSDELWAIDYEFAGIEALGDDPYTLVAQGLSGSIVSRRSQLIVLDDVIKSSESIQNPEIRRKLIVNWQEVVQPTLLEGGRAIALGTRFSTVDIYASRFNTKNGWRVITQQAIVSDRHGVERSYWPEFYTLEHLRKLRTEDPIAFSFQFQNHPVSTSELDFPQDWLKLADHSHEFDMLCVGMDLSSALKERNDWTVMTLAGLNGDKVEMLDFRRIRSMGNLEKIDLLCELLADWGLVIESEPKPDGEVTWQPTDLPVTINIEAIAYQQSMQADAKEILHDKRSLHNLVLRGVTGYRGDKLSRLRGVLGLFQTGRVTWNRYVNWEPYWAELMNYGSADHDDCPDSMLLAIKGLIGPGRLQPAWGEWEMDAA